MMLTERTLACCGLIGLLLLGACDAPDQPGNPSGHARAGQLRLGSVLGAGGLDGYLKADAVVPLSFPADHGAHPGFRSEWWYLTVVLESSEGREFGVQFTLFRQALSPSETQPSSETEGLSATETANRWRSQQVYLAHFALTDVTAGLHESYERVSGGHPTLAGVAADPLRLWLEDWTLEALPGQVAEIWRLNLRDGDSALQVDLNLNVPLILQGDRGLSAKGPEQASYYYSIPRIPVSGTLTFAATTHQVSGSGWLDREWSTSVLSAGQIGWDWFALQIDDGRSLMLFQLRNADGHRDPYDQGNVVTVGGCSQALRAADFLLTPRRFWVDDEGVGWPVEWQLDLGAERWRLVAAVDDQRMDTLLTYWEGLVDVFEPGGRRIGRGYMELTGYGGE